MNTYKWILVIVAITISQYQITSNSRSQLNLFARMHMIIMTLLTLQVCFLIFSIDFSLIV